MIVCVVENYAKDVLTINVIDTCLAVTSLQREYVAAVMSAAKKKKNNDHRAQINAECSSLYEEDDEISRLRVILPQRVETCVILDVAQNNTK